MFPGSGGRAPEIDHHSHTPLARIRRFRGSFASGCRGLEELDRIARGVLDQDLRGGMTCITGPAQRGIVVVRFEEGATQAERQEAVDQVDGEVVGGLASDTREGFYYLAVPDDPDGEIVCAAAETLDAMPRFPSARSASPTTPIVARRAVVKDGRTRRPLPFVSNRSWALQI